MLVKYKKLLKKNNTLYYIIAGEASGDLHGSHLIKSLQLINSDLHFRGLGGPLMSGRGMVCLSDFNRLSVMGFVEIIKDIPFFLKLKKLLLQDIIKTKPTKIILIDYPGFNLRLAKKIKEISSIPIIYYVSPQIWAWKENRIQILKRHVNSLVVLFPFEKEWFQKRNMRVQYFGHPLIDLIQKKQLKIGPPQNTIGFFPGSRLQEIKRHLPIFIKLIKLLLTNNKNLKFIISLPRGTSALLFEKIKKLSGVVLSSENSFNIFNKINVAVVASGTATLECAISKTPFIVVYKTSFLSWLIAKMFLSIPFVSIVNILANKEIVKEHLQYNIKIKEMAHQINLLLKNPNIIKKNLLEITRSLGNGNAYQKTAKHILKLDNNV